MVRRRRRRHLVPAQSAGEVGTASALDDQGLSDSAAGSISSIRGGLVIGHGWHLLSCREPTPPHYPHSHGDARTVRRTAPPTQAVAPETYSGIHHCGGRRPIACHETSPASATHHRATHTETAGDRRGRLASLREAHHLIDLDPERDGPVRLWSTPSQRRTCRSETPTSSPMRQIAGPCSAQGRPTTGIGWSPRTRCT